MNSAQAEQLFAVAVGAHESELKMAQAIAEHQRGKAWAAALAYREILAVNGEHVAALNNLSLLLDDELALPLLHKALSIDPDHLDALINITARFLAQGQAQHAHAYLQRAQSLAPEDARVLQLASQLPSPPPVGLLTMPVLPRYSIIMPTHKRAPLLGRALSSLKAQFNTALMEIIVVSDCEDAETDATCRQWLGPADTYVRRSGAPGPSASRNLALQLAKGQFILFLDDDDAWQPQTLENLEACEPLQKGQSVYFNCTIVKERRTPNGPEYISETFADMQGRLNEDVFVKNQVHMSCFAFPRHVLQGLEFDPHMRAYEDWDYLLSAFSRQMPVHVPLIGSQVYEVDDDTTDRRGSSSAAQDQNAVLDYLYVYRRHKVGAALQTKRAQLLASTGLSLPAVLL